MLVEKTDSGVFDQIYALMETSFPLEEYRPYPEQKALLSRPAYGLYAARDDREGNLLGFAAVWEWEDFAFIEHIAVSPHYRNGGLGGKLLDQVVALLGKPVCLEVEPPDGGMASRRIGFYQRHGFFLNPYPYIQPSISQGRNPIPLQIMTYGREISEGEFLTIRNRLYRQVYQVEVS